MQKRLLLFCLNVIALVLLSACSEKEDTIPEYIGKWDVADLYINDEWVSVSSSGPASHLWNSYVKFSEDGKFVSSGYLGNVVGTYAVSGNTFICYSNGVEFSRYELVSVDGHVAVFYASVFDEFLKIRCHLGNDSDNGGHVCEH